MTTRIKLSVMCLAGTLASMLTGCEEDARATVLLGFESAVQSLVTAAVTALFQVIDAGTTTT